MAKKTKDSEALETKASTKKSIVNEIEKKLKTTNKKNTTSKETNTVKNTSTPKNKATTKKTTTKKATKTDNATTKAKRTTASTKSTKTSTKKPSTKKEKTTKKNVVKTKASKSKKSTGIEEKHFQAEYYDLPYLYNQTVVKILAQTPKMLFIYWEISEYDRNMFKQRYGDNFFNVTKPVLIIFNDTMQYSFEIDINDFANSWYLHINDANCEYHVELGRRPISYQTYSPEKNNYQNNYIPHFIYLTSSNEITAPNNKIMFNYPNNTVKFRNVKTGEIIEKSIFNFTFITNNGIFNVQELYKYLFPNEKFEYQNVPLGNSSSGGFSLSSSGMFSSQFK